MCWSAHRNVERHVVRSQERAWANLRRKRRRASKTEEEKLPTKIAHVIGVSLGHTRSNPMNIMNCEDRRSSMATVISFDNTAKMESNYVTMTAENKIQTNRVGRSMNGSFCAFWHGQTAYENGRVKRFETEHAAWEFLARCEAAGKIIH
jgi:hypothetical protein